MEAYERFMQKKETIEKSTTIRPEAGVFKSKRGVDVSVSYEDTKDSKTQTIVIRYGRGSAIGNTLYYPDSKGCWGIANGMIDNFKNDVSNIGNERKEKK